jgi:hypothetical protein
VIIINPKMGKSTWGKIQRASNGKWEERTPQKLSHKHKTRNG